MSSDVLVFASLDGNARVMGWKSDCHGDDVTLLGVYSNNGVVALTTNELKTLVDGLNELIGGE
jgi:hypothetical protein